MDDDSIATRSLHRHSQRATALAVRAIVGDRPLSRFRRVTDPRRDPYTHPLVDAAHQLTGEALVTSPCSRCGNELSDEEICPRCGAIVRALKSPMIIDGRYEVERTLGAGSMGVVHLGRDLRLGRKVAIKMIAPEMAAEPLATGRFAREAATLAAIRSDHVVRVHAFGKHGGSHFFVMDYVHGADVDEIITAYAHHGVYVPVHRALTILRQVAKGLTAVHEAGIVHRDVKPGNIVIEEETGRPVLVDFGLARSIERLSMSKNRSTVGAGTPWYMAPEQADDEEESFVISPRTDVYALGCTAFELFTARPPFDSIDPDELVHQHLHETPPLVSTLRPDLKRFDDVIARSLVKTPSRRFDSAQEFVDALDEAATDEEANRLAPMSVEPIALGDGSARRQTIRCLVITADDHLLQLAARALPLAFDGAAVTVTSAGSDLEVATIAQFNPPQIVVLDTDVPGLEGVETLSFIRAMPHGANVRIVVVTETKPLERWRFPLVGVRDFVQKPAEVSDFVVAISEVARRNGWIAERSSKPT